MSGQRVALGAGPRRGEPLRGGLGLGENRGFCFPGRPTGDTAAAAGPNRWQLQAAARRLLPHEKQLARCHCTRARGVEDVRVYRAEGSAFFSGLVQCGSVWICPVCAGKVAERRAEEVQRGIDYWIAAGGGALMVTLTFRHGFRDPLADTLERFGKALRRLKSGRAYQQLMRDFGVVGEIRALEVTHGRNGWHPHTHALVFTHKRLDRIERQHYECRLFLLWRAACEREGLGDPTFEHGINLRVAKDAGDYVAKWGFATELTRAHLKKAQRGGRTPWQLLADYCRGDRRAGWLFREFAHAFKGRRQLYYSAGLRQRLGLRDEMTDQELLALEPEPRELVATIPPDRWRLVVWYRAHHDVLEAAERAGAAGVAAVLERLRRRVVQEIGTDGSWWRWQWIDRVESAIVRI